MVGFFVNQAEVYVWNSGVVGMKESESTLVGKTTNCGSDDKGLVGHEVRWK